MPRQQPQPTHTAHLASGQRFGTLTAHVMPDLLPQVFVHTIQTSQRQHQVAPATYQGAYLVPIGGEKPVLRITDTPRWAPGKYQIEKVL